MPQVAQDTPVASLAMPAHAFVRGRETTKQVVPLGAPAATPREVPKQIPVRKGKTRKKKRESYLVTTERVAAMLKLSTGEVDSLLDEGRIPSSEVHGQRMVEFDDVVKYAYALEREKDAALRQAMEDGAVTIEQAARYLDLPEKHLARRIKAGGVPAHEDADGQRMVRTADLLAFSKTLQEERLAAYDEIVRLTEAAGAYEIMTPEFMGVKEYYNDL